VELCRPLERKREREREREREGPVDKVGSQRKRRQGEETEEKGKKNFPRTYT
jgi:hypothetical protein